MENMDSTIQPNLSANLYRNMTPADQPPISDKDLQFILIYNERSAILGGSNLSGRYWSGTVWYYNDISDFQRENAFLAKKSESGVCDAAYLSHNKFLIGEDSGVLQISGLADVADSELQELQCLDYACQHDDSLLTLSAFSNKTHAVTSGADCCIKVWDLEELCATHSFAFAHTDIVTCVDTHPNCDSVFMSVSLDCEALMWDVRQSKPAKSILQNSTGLTAVSWNSLLEHMLAIGARDGSVTLFDLRNLQTPVLQDVSIFPRSVHKLLFNPSSEHSGQLACCCDDTTVKVINANKDLSLIYENDNHTDFVRGLTWFKDELYSCSWDNSVVKHIVNPGNV